MSTATEPEITVESITPDIAAEWLETMNTNNRTLRQRRVNKYASDMAAGEWHFTGDSIRISEDNVLLDGQHRLWAVIESGVTIQSVVIRRLSSDVMPVLDSGLGRTMGDVLKTHDVANAAHAAAAARTFLGFKRGWLLDSGRMSTISRDEQLAWVLDNNESVQWAIKLSLRFNHAIGRGSTAAWSAFHLALEERVGREKAEEFIIPTLTGVALQAGDPRLALRNWLLNRATRGARNDAALQLATSILAFNKWVKGKRAASLKSWDSSTPFPLVETR